MSSSNDKSNMVEDTLKQEGVTVPVMLEYVWIGGDNEFRSKMRTIYLNNYSDKVELVSTLESKLDDLTWNYDGSSTNQANGADSEVILKPVKVYNAYGLPGVKQVSCASFVLCQTVRSDGTPLENNHRVEAVKVFDKYKDLEPWFGLEQEYFIKKDGKIVNSDQREELEGKNYCGAGASHKLGRTIADNHYSACLKLGIKISGYNAEVAEGQWEFQIGPAEGIRAGDDLMMARYMLIRTAELHDCDVTFDPKPINMSNGSGCHTNFSTVKTRTLVGQYLVEIKNLEKNYKALSDVINTTENKERLTGTHETASYDSFSYGVADRTATIRIPRQTDKDGFGYFELRTPPSDCDPYQVTSLLTDCCCNYNLVSISYN